MELHVVRLVAEMAGFLEKRGPRLFVGAFPAALEELRDEPLKPEHEVEALAQAYQLRCINRFLDFFGLIEWEDGDKSAELARFRRSALFDRFAACR